MRLLLDTHIVLWWLADDSKLPVAARRVVASSEHEPVVSAASAWEIGIKKAAGRLEAPEDLLEALDDNDITTLSMTAEHALVAASLPPHHADPFDRMLVAQALTERLVLVSVDRRFSAYGVDLLPLGAS